VDDIITLIVQAGHQVGDEIAAVGLGIPTTLDGEGRLEPCPNLPTLIGCPLGAVLAEKLSWDVFVENDASCFALGEWRFGAGRGTSLMVGITLGTGIGTGIVMEGRPFRGAHGRAGEIWRSPLNLLTNAGPSPHVEAHVSGTGLEDAYTGATGTRLTGGQIAALADGGDPVASDVFEALGATLGGVIVWLTDLLDPDAVVLGGSVVGAYHHFEKSIRANLRGRTVHLLVSQLGDRAALYGASTVAFVELEKRRM
jgi:predicted NBD/HSP70 family sugar kinase